MALLGMKSIPGYEGRYSIDKDGRVFSHINGIFLAPTFSQRYIAVNLVGSDRKTRRFLVHRLMGIVFLNMEASQQIDHKDGDPSNNRLDNLRVCTSAQNQFNRNITKSNTSGFKGVTWDKGWKGWKASIKQNGKSYNLGRFDSKQEAAKAYDAAAKIRFGDFAVLNHSDEVHS